MNLFFGRKLYFLRQVEIEYEKFANPEIYKDDENVNLWQKKAGIAAAKGNWQV